MREIFRKAGRPLFIILSIIIFTLVGCTNKEAIKKETPLKQTEKASQERKVPSIALIQIKDNSVVISANQGFQYTVYKPNDPFKMIVEIPGVLPGKYEGRIKGKEGVITEILAQHVKVPIEGTKLEITLQEPITLKAEYKEGSLILKAEESLADETSSNMMETTAEEKKEANTVTTDARVIRNIEMYRRGGSTVVSIIGDGRLHPDILPANNKLIIDIKDVSINAKQLKQVAKPLKAIRWGTFDNNARIILDLEPETTFDVVSLGNKIEISLRSSGTELESIAMAKENNETPEETINNESNNQPVAGKYTGKRISLDFQDADIIPIFRLLADVSGYNIVVDPKVKGKITMKLINVPWDQALDLILKTHNLDKVIEGNIIRIAPTAVIAKEKEAVARIKAAQRKIEPLVTKVFPVSYADVKKVKDAIEKAKILSERGSISVDERISSLIIKDVESNMPKVEQLIKTLDRQTPQVLIEARIVEVNSNVSKEFGIRWGLNLTSKSRLVNLGGLTPYTVDFPSGAGPGSGSGITFGILNPTRTMSLDLEISALETSGKLKIISNPRIMTIDNNEAVISQGKSIPVRKLTAEGTISTEFKDVKLELKVKPHITPDNSIILSVQATKEELDPTIPSVEGVPGTDKKEAKTNVIIKNGETLVIGGIYKTVNNDSESGVPTLKDVPFLGWLFKNNKKSEQTNELLIFITPKIVKNK